MTVMKRKTKARKFENVPEENLEVVWRKLGFEKHAPWAEQDDEDKQDFARSLMSGVRR